MGRATPFSRTGEIRRAQPAHGQAFVIQDSHVELNQFDTGAKLGQVALRLRKETGGRQDEENSACGPSAARSRRVENEAESGLTHRYSSRGRGRGGSAVAVQDGWRV